MFKYEEQLISFRCECGNSNKDSMRVHLHSINRIDEVLCTKCERVYKFINGIPRQIKY